MVISNRLLFWTLLLLIFGCKPSGRSLKPYDIVKENDDEAVQSGLDGQIDPSAIAALLANVPEGESRITDLEISVSGDGLTHYTFKIGPALTTECGLAYDYILQPIDQPIAINIDNIPDGDIQLCVVGQHSSGMWQPYERATATTWNKQTGALGSPESLTAIPAQGRVSLVWERPEGTIGFLVARSSLPIEWQPTEGETYEVGPIEDIELVYSDTGASHIDTELTDSRSYYYAVYSYDVQFRYSPPALIAAIPSVDPYTWVRLEPGAFLRDAVIGGTRFDNSRNLYLCRTEHVDQAGTNFGQHIGKFVPAAPGDLTAGDCYYAFGDRTFRVTQNFEILVITRGRFEDWLQWTPVTATVQILPTFFVGAVAQNPQTNIFVCRFPVGSNGYFTPGKFASGMDGCHVDVFSATPAERGLRSNAEFQILNRKSL
ncbi:MAG: hypothetical protein ACOH5I_06755 [Oligoflexus sp.]